MTQVSAYICDNCNKRVFGDLVNDEKTKDGWVFVRSLQASRLNTTSRNWEAELGGKHFCSVSCFIAKMLQNFSLTLQDLKFKEVSPSSRSKPTVEV